MAAAAEAAAGDDAESQPAKKGGKKKLIVLVALVLLLAGWWRGALAWFTAVPATLGAVLLAKLSTMACQGMMPPIGLLSPSGHAASAAVVYGGLLALVEGMASSQWCDD